MNGRLEQEQKIFRILNNKLINYPNFVQEWILNLRASDCSAKTCRDYLNKITRYLEYIGVSIETIKINDLSDINTRKYFISIKTKEDKNGNIVNTSDSYQQSVWCCLNNFFDFLNKQNYIKRNPMKLIKKPKNKDLVRINEDRILLNKYDFKKILNSVENGSGSDKAKSFQEHMKNRDMAIMLIFMSTGIRKDALSQLNIDNIDFNTRTLSVIDKGDIWHYYELTDKTIDYINNWLSEREDISSNSPLFISYQGNRLSGNSIYKLVEKYSEDALGFHISPHKLRSGFCSVMYNETRDIEKVRRMVGHANVSTTQRYIVTKNKERREVANIMNNIL